MSKTRDELIRYADGMSFESAWRAYAGMVEGGELTMEDLQVVIKPELYREVERYFAGKRLESKMIRLPGGEHRIIGDEELDRSDYDYLPSGGVGVKRSGLRPVAGEKPVENETSVLEWLAVNDFECIDDSQVQCFRKNCVDVYLDEGHWKVIRHTKDSARLIDYTMHFSPRTAPPIITEAIARSL